MPVKTSIVGIIEAMRQSDAHRFRSLSTVYCTLDRTELGLFPSLTLPNNGYFVGAVYSLALIVRKNGGVGSSESH